MACEAQLALDVASTLPPRHVKDFCARLVETMDAVAPFSASFTRALVSFILNSSAAPDSDRFFLQLSKDVLASAGPIDGADGGAQSEPVLSIVREETRGWVALGVMDRVALIADEVDALLSLASELGAGAVTRCAG
jgi:hypothetical protein